MMLDEKYFEKAFPKAGKQTLKVYSDQLPYYMGVYEINTPLRIANFFAQLSHESADFTRLTENLNYSVSALKTLFGRHRISLEDAQKYGRTANQRANQEMIANILYGGEWGRRNLGNVSYGDGWKYRGRGLIQKTGRANYKAYSKAIGDEKLLIDNPDLILQPQYAAWTACWWWKNKGLNEIADTGNIVLARQRVNGGNIGLEEVMDRYRENLEYFA